MPDKHGLPPPCVKSEECLTYRYGQKIAISLFGSGAALGRALGISRTAVGFWPETLTIRQQDEVIGAAIRLNKITPEQAKELITNERQRDQRGASDAH